MKCYKVAVGNEIVAVCTEYDFCRYQKKHGAIVATGPDDVEAVQAGGCFYHDGWMKVTGDIAYIAAAVQEISEEDYGSLKAQLESGGIPEDGSLDEIMEEPVAPAQEEDAEHVRKTAAQVLQEDIILAARYAEV